MPLPGLRTIGVCAPAGAVDPALLANGVDFLRKQGFQVKVTPHAGGKKGYFSGSADERFADLEMLWRDPEVDLILAARGGFGCAHLLDRLAQLPPTGKFVAGFSDLTALLWAIERHHLAVPVALPMAAKFGTYTAETQENAWKALSGIPRQVSALTVLKPGDFSGEVLAGNATVAASLCGTEHFPDCRGRVLVLEDVGEPLYRLDRVLTQLEMCGAFSDCAGVVFGEFTGTDAPEEELNALLRRVTRQVKGGVLANLRYGHEPGDFVSLNYRENITFSGDTVRIGKIC